MNLLNAEYENKNPCEYAWKMENDDYIPEKYLLLIPESLTCICNCKYNNTSKRCNSMRCKCKKMEPHAQNTVDAKKSVIMVM